MAKKYTLTSQLRIVNGIFKFLLRRGIGPQRSWLLTVKGRKSGKLYTTPVSPIERDGERYIVSPYGEVGWVKNARVSGEVTLTRGSESDAVKVQEVKPPEQMAALLKEYLQREQQYVGPYFDANAESSVEMFAAEAARHPVFRVIGSASSAS